MKPYILLLIGVWLGLVLGLSFIEAPLKFQAPGITVKLGLGIGSLVFGASSKIQLLFSAFLFINLLFNFKFLPQTGLVLSSILILIVGIQSAYLLPLLDARATLIINNNPVPDSPHHIYFVVLEILKLITLTGLYINLYNRWKI